MAEQVISSDWRETILIDDSTAPQTSRKHNIVQIFETIESLESTR